MVLLAPGTGVVTFAKCPQRLLDTPSLLFVGYRLPSPQWYGGRGVKLTTHLYTEYVELYLHSSRSFPFCIVSTTAVGYTQSPIKWVPTVLSPVVRRMGREADHSLCVAIPSFHHV